MQRSIQTILSQSAAMLEEALGLDSREARIEAQCLLQQVLGVARAYLLAHPERGLTDVEDATCRNFLQQRLQGEPIAYLLGEREFFGLNLGVTPATLIPRPDTELLVELVLQRIPFSFLSPASGREDGRGRGKVLDMGTGSGAIALAIASQRHNAEVWACDVSQAALAVAQNNARRLGLENVHFIESDWFLSLGGQRFDLIVSNPPYIAADDPHLTQGDVRFEPRSALVSGVDGLEDIRHIVNHAGAHLEKQGWLLLEHGYNQAQQVRALLQQTGFTDVFSARDLSGIERCSGGQIR